MRMAANSCAVASLQQAAVCGGAHGLDNPFVSVKGGEDDGGRLVACGLQPAQHAHAVEPRHFQVEQQHMGAQRSQHVQCLLAVARCARHLEIGLCAEHGDQPIAHNWMVVHHQQPDYGFRHGSAFQRHAL